MIQFTTDMQTHFDYKTREKELYQLWEDQGVFNPDTAKTEIESGNNFSIIMPPPNANDPLHVGHALFVSIEDIMMRYHRMIGDNAVWIPGTDHAGIETQFVFEKKLQKEKKSRFDFDRETLYQQIWEYVQQNSQVAISQIKQLGASADWSRFKFTLDPEIVEEVLKTFYKLHEEGLIYRDLQLVQFCTKCGTSYSQLEVNYIESQDPQYTIQYGPIQVLTTRPETVFGDVAIAVHPDDSRYTQYIGQDITIQIEGCEPITVRVVADEYADPEFGTGAVKITPYHDMNDFQVWQRHKDEIPYSPSQVIDTRGKFVSRSNPSLIGLSVKSSREEVVKLLSKSGMLVSVNTVNIHKVGTCYKCGTRIEPLPLPQFFIAVNTENNSLVKNALAALDSNETEILGAGREKILRHWLENLRDWNISRQIVWGIKIPVWYKVDGFEDQITVSFIDKSNTKVYGTLQEILKNYSFEDIRVGLQTVAASKEVLYELGTQTPADGNWLPETDTFDTWFSSAQWPVITLKTAKDGDFDRFYPTSVMETGYDILPFWVMRMMLLGIYATQQSPFSTVYLHGLVRDAQGKKMSKSKGNVINPLSVVEEFGADALRLALVIRTTPGQDKSVGQGDFKAARNFTTKLWNATKFCTSFAEETTGDTDVDEAFAKRLNSIIDEVTKALDEHQVGLAADRLYDEFWHWFCDECIEAQKNKKLSYQSLLQGLITFVKLLHPFTPFVTEEVWQVLLEKKLVTHPLVTTSAWPKKN